MIWIKRFLFHELLNYKFKLFNNCRLFRLSISSWLSFYSLWFQGIKLFFFEVVELKMIKLSIDFVIILLMATGAVAIPPVSFLMLVIYVFFYFILISLTKVLLILLISFPVTTTCLFLLCSCFPFSFISTVMFFISFLSSEVFFKKIIFAIVQIYIFHLVLFHNFFS